MRKRAPELERGVQGGWCRERKAARTDTGSMRADAKDGRAGGVPLIAVSRRNKGEGSRRSKGEGNRRSKEEGNRRSKGEGAGRAGAAGINGKAGSRVLKTGRKRAGMKANAESGVKKLGSREDGAENGTERGS